MTMQARAIQKLCILLPYIILHYINFLLTMYFFLQLMNIKEVARNKYHRYVKNISWITTYTLQGSFYSVTVGYNYELILIFIQVMSFVLYL